MQKGLADRLQGNAAARQWGHNADKQNDNPCRKAVFLQPGKGLRKSEKLQKQKHQHRDRYG
ncbi:hypothetical protein D3C73_1389160 [compost metagenome]